MRLTMIGPSTVLLEREGRRPITDPLFGTLGHVAHARLRPPAFKREDLRNIDGVLVSHAHWERTDRKFLNSPDVSILVLAPTWTCAARSSSGARSTSASSPRRLSAVRSTAARWNALGATFPEGSRLTLLTASSRRLKDAPGARGDRKMGQSPGGALPKRCGPWHAPCKSRGWRCAMVRKPLVNAAMVALASGAFARKLTNLHVIPAALRG